MREMSPEPTQEINDFVAEQNTQIAASQRETSGIEAIQTRKEQEEKLQADIAHLPELIAAAYGPGYTDLKSKQNTEEARNFLRTMGVDTSEIDHAHPKPPLRAIKLFFEHQLKEIYKGEHHE